MVLGLLGLELPLLEHLSCLLDFLNVLLKLVHLKEIVEFSEESLDQGRVLHQLLQFLYFVHIQLHVQKLLFGLLVQRNHGFQRLHLLHEVSLDVLVLKQLVPGLVLLVFLLNCLLELVASLNHDVQQFLYVLVGIDVLFLNVEDVTQGGVLEVLFVVSVQMAEEIVHIVVEGLMVLNFTQRVLVRSDLSDLHLHGHLQGRKPSDHQSHLLFGEY